jgi:protein gp37
MVYGTITASPRNRFSTRVNPGQRGGKDLTGRQLYGRTYDEMPGVLQPA